MKVLYGTGNQAKLSAMKHRLEQLDIELISLNDLKTEGYRIPDAPEDGKTPLENARQRHKSIIMHFIFRCFPVIQGCILIMYQTRYSRECM